jgi:2-methylcitrate dehydratase PrpD
VSSYGAKFSLPYSIAVMLVRGRAGLAEFTDAAIQDPEVLNLAAKVRYVLDPAIDYPRHFSGHLALPENGVEKILDSVTRLEQLSSIDTLADLLSPS